MTNVKKSTFYIDFILVYINHRYNLSDIKKIWQPQQETSFKVTSALENIYIPFSLTLKNPNRAFRGEALESTRNVTIANGERLNNYIEVRDELLALGD